MHVLPCTHVPQQLSRARVQHLRRQAGIWMKLHSASRWVHASSCRDQQALASMVQAHASFGASGTSLHKHMQAHTSSSAPSHMCVGVGCGDHRTWLIWLPLNVHGLSMLVFLNHWYAQLHRGAQAAESRTSLEDLERLTGWVYEIDLSICHVAMVGHCIGGLPAFCLFGCKLQMLSNASALFIKA